MADWDDFTLEMVRGTYFRFQATIKVKSTGLPADLTGYTKFFSTGKRWYQDADADAVFALTSTAGEITVVTANAGLIEVAVMPLKTTPLDNRRTRLFVDVKVLDPGVHPLVPLRGTITVLPGVTEASS